MDEIDKFSKRMNELRTAVEDMRKNGVSEDILICWLVVHLKISKKKAKQFIHSYQEFYTQLLKSNILNNLDKKKDE